MRTQAHGIALMACLVGCVGDAPTTPLADASPVVDMGVAVDSGNDVSVIPDASADVGDAAGPWTPKKLPALALWLDGSVGVTAAVGNKVSKWADQSGNGNDATQQSATLQPILAPGAINNRDGLYFDKTGSPVALNIASPNQASMAGDFTVMVVFKSALLSSTAGDLFRAEASSTTDALLQVAPPDLIASVAVSGSGKAAFAPQAIFGDGKPHFVGMRRSAAKLEVLADGASASVVSPPAGDVGGKFIIGGQIKGPIAEVVLSTGTVDDTALGLLNAYLKKKYAL